MDTLLTAAALYLVLAPIPATVFMGSLVLLCSGALGVRGRRQRDLPKRARAARKVAAQ